MLTDTQKIEAIQKAFNSQNGSILGGIKFASDVSTILIGKEPTDWYPKYEDAIKWLEAENASPTGKVSVLNAPTPTMNDYRKSKEQGK